MVIFLLVLFILTLVTSGIFARLYILTNKQAAYFKRALDVKNERHDTTITNKITLSKNQLETAFDAITDFICAIDHNFVITRVNKSYSDFVQIPIPQLLGKHCYEVFWKRNESCEHCPAKGTFANGKPVLKRSFKMPGKDRALFFTIATYPVLTDAGQTQNVIEYIRDSSEEKSILEQLVRSEKLASIGTMTAGVAHELTNPLSGISGTAANMLQMPEKYGLNEKGTSRVVSILEASSRASAIVKDLLHLSKKEDGTSMLTDLNSMVVKAIQSIKLKGYTPVEFKISTDPHVNRVLCDPIKLEQVILNLFTNAIQSVQEKKTLVLKEGMAYSGLILVATQASSTDVRIDITDNGTGVADSIKGKIFDPFFTTRPPGEGVGLGLSICQKIIEEHHGKIIFETTDLHTTFSILLPLQTPLSI